MKPSLAKKAISLILLFGMSGVGVSTAHARNPQQPILCWVDWNKDGYVNWVDYDRDGQRDLPEESEEVIITTPSDCQYWRNVNASQ